MWIKPLKNSAFYEVIWLLKFIFANHKKINRKRGKIDGR